MWPASDRVQLVHLRAAVGIQRMLEELIKRAPAERHAALQARLDATAVQSEQL